MNQSEFDQLVVAGLKAIPRRFLKKLSNVVVTVEDEPTAEQLASMRLGPGRTLFGLYQGVPQTSRGSGYTLVLPDKITIFKGPIARAAGGDRELIKAIVKDTVWHELGHHFGLSEGEVRRREANRR